MALLGFTIIWFILYQFGGSPLVARCGDLRYDIATLAFWGTSLYLTLQNLIRKIKGDESLMLFEIFDYLKGDTRLPTKSDTKRMMNPPIPAELQTNRKSGFVFGRQEKDGYVCKPTEKEGHIGVFGGSGLGKTSCLAIPSIRAWQGPVFAIDIKGELSELSKVDRTNLQIFNPSDPNALGYDPYYFVDADPSHKTQRIKRIVYSLIKRPNDKADPFWVTSARNLLLGEMLFFYDLNYSFIETMHIIQSTPQQEIVNAVFKSDNDKAVIYINEFKKAMDGGSQTVDGIIMQLMTDIKIFATDDDVIAAFSRERIITPDALESGGDVFIQVPESNLEIWAPMLNLITSQFLTAFESREPRGYPILMLLDEFPRLGVVHGIASALATLRSRRITITLLLQSISQLDYLYGSDQRKTIMDNLRYTAILGVTEQSTQEYFSLAVGTYDRLIPGQSQSSRGLMPGGADSFGMSWSTAERRIIKPEQFGHLGEDIILLTTYGYFRVKKAPYYRDGGEGNAARAR